MRNINSVIMIAGVIISLISIPTIIVSGVLYYDDYTSIDTELGEGLFSDRFQDGDVVWVKGRVLETDQNKNDDGSYSTTLLLDSIKWIPPSNETGHKEITLYPIYFNGKISDDHDRYIIVKVKIHGKDFLRSFEGLEIKNSNKNLYIASFLFSSISLSIGFILYLIPTLLNYHFKKKSDVKSAF